MVSDAFDAQMYHFPWKNAKTGLLVINFSPRGVSPDGQGEHGAGGDTDGRSVREGHIQVKLFLACNFVLIDDQMQMRNT